MIIVLRKDSAKIHLWEKRYVSVGESSSLLEPNNTHLPFLRCIGPYNAVLQLS
jgi:hypothetical protein